MTHRGELVPGKPVHYVRITPADPEQPHLAPDPDAAHVQIANGGESTRPATSSAATSFELVRLGLRSALIHWWSIQSR